MPCRLGILVCLLYSLAISTVEAAPAPPAAIVCSKDSTPLEKLAAKEVRRYIYLRTGKLLPIVASDADAPAGSSIVVGTKDRLLDSTASPDAKLAKVIAEVKPLAPQQFLLTTFDRGDRTVLLVVGGDPIGTLYGAYRLAERLGARFYLHGDVLPDEKIPLEMPMLHETGKPLFELRGIQPFHDFPEGPDWWSRDTYKAVLGQLPKMGMNFFGLHTYPENGVGPEPLVWIGPPNEIAADGHVKASYPSRHFTTVGSNGSWGNYSAKTGDYAFGAAELFECDNFGPTTCATRRLGVSERKTRRR